jgi:hypothetical protein
MQSTCHFFFYPLFSCHMLARFLPSMVEVINKSFRIGIHVITPNPLLWAGCERSHLPKKGHLITLMWQIIVEYPNRNCRRSYSCLKVQSLATFRGSRSLKLFYYSLFTTQDGTLALHYHLTSIQPQKEKVHHTFDSTTNIILTGICMSCIPFKSAK